VVQLPSRAPFQRSTMAVRPTVNRMVAGSNPAAGATPALSVARDNDTKITGPGPSVIP
jgi:hypothetical protein